jgi:hypothetical protein
LPPGWVREERKERREKSWVGVGLGRDTRKTMCDDHASGATHCCHIIAATLADVSHKGTMYGIAHMDAA